MQSDSVGKGSTALRLQNKITVLNVIKEHNLSTRAEIASIANITKATISEIVSELIADGFIIESDTATDEIKMGRKGTPLVFNSECSYAISVDLGGTKIRLSLFNAGLELVQEKTVFYI